MNVYALIGDIVNSRQIKNRQIFQEHYHQIINKINQRYAEQLVTPFTITAGDEFQGLLYRADLIFQIIDEISIELLPNQVRFGLGYGEIITQLNPKLSIGSDGPAYWNAREAIAYIHDNNDYGSNLVYICLDDKERMKLVNTLVSSAQFIRSKWTSTQLEVLKALIQSNYYREKFEHKKLSQVLGISASALNKRIKASGIKNYLRNNTLAATLLELEG